MQGTLQLAAISFQVALVRFGDESIEKGAHQQQQK